ncbi:MAG: hypothetical protein AB7O28_18625 [Vicinamibacterales bacterium]
MPVSSGLHVRVARGLAAAGATLVVATSLVGDWSPALLAFVAWALVPYAVLAAVGGRLGDAWTVAGAGAAALAVEAGIRLSVFVFPRGSTAAIALVFSPALILVGALPAGAVAGAAIGWAHRRGRRGIAVATSAVALAAVGLVTLGLARPDLFPTVVYERHRALERIGVPRVVAGASRFDRVVLDDRPGWRQTGALDGDAGDEIALVEPTRVRLLAPDSLADAGSLPLGGVSRRWNWFSRLARVGGRVVVVDTGGGFQDTQVHELDGTLVWQYHPDPDLPPSALVPADLDGDGDAELYASTVHAVVRLDGAGREVWRRAASMAHLVAAAPPSDRDPAWVLAAQSSGVDVLGADGAGLGRIPLGGGYPLGAADWAGRRHLLVGGRTLRMVALDGTTAFEWTVDDMTVADACTVRFEPGGDRYLALVAGAPRDTGRWRLQIVSRQRQVLYDEVFASAPRLLTARRADGADTLLVSTDALVALRPSPSPGAP